MGSSSAPRDASHSVAAAVAVANLGSFMDYHQRGALSIISDYHDAVLLFHPSHALLTCVFLCRFRRSRLVTQKKARKPAFGYDAGQQSS